MAECDETNHCSLNSECIGDICISSSCVNNGVVCDHHGACINEGCDCFYNYAGTYCETCVGDKFELVGTTCNKKCTTADDCG